MFYFLIIVVLIALALGHRESKPLLYLLYALLFLISVGVQGGFDITGYEKHFDNPWAASDNEDRSYYFEIFMIFLKGVGLNFQQARIILFFIWSASILAFLFKFCKKPTYALALCFFFPILTYSSQLRNGVAMSFVYWGIYFVLLKRKSFHSLIIFSILLFIASLIHSISYVYLICFIAFFNIFSTKQLISVCSTIAIFLAFFISSGFLYDFVALFFSEYYANFYFNELEPFSLGNSNVFVGIIINIWFTYQAEKFENKFDHENNSLTNGFSHFVLRLNILLLALCPLMLISLTFYRIYQNVFVLSVISIANASAVGGPRSQYLSNVYAMFYFVVTFFYIYGQGEFLLGWDNLRLL